MIALMLPDNLLLYMYAYFMLVYYIFSCIIDHLTCMSVDIAMSSKWQLEWLGMKYVAEYLAGDFRYITSAIVMSIKVIYHIFWGN